MDEQTGFNPKRRLCPDGTCTGVIGRDGRCGECGRAVNNLSADEATSDVVSVAAPTFTPPESAGEGSAVAAAGALGAVVGEGFDPRRRLCDDGTCVGVIGADGACTVCGRRGA